MLIAATPDAQPVPAELNYSEVRVWEPMSCETYNGRSGGEPSLAVHNVFSQAIPGAFGMSFLRRLIALTETPPPTENASGN